MKIITIAVDYRTRRFIFDRIDELIENSDFPSGYVLIKGEPGVGETALIAWLVKNRGYIHHVNARSQGITSASAFLKNICVQLIRLAIISRCR